MGGSVAVPYSIVRTVKASLAIGGFGYEPEGSDEGYVRSLVARIGELSGGIMSGLPDPATMSTRSICGVVDHRFAEALIYVSA